MIWWALQQLKSKDPKARLQAVAKLGAEEMLICSDKREALYEWQCADMEKRLQFMDDLDAVEQSFADFKSLCVA